MACQTQDEFLPTDPLYGSLRVLLVHRSSPQTRQASRKVGSHEHLLGSIDATERVLWRCLLVYLHLNSHFHPFLILTAPDNGSADPQLPRNRDAVGGSGEYILCQQVALASVLVVCDWDGADGRVGRMVGLCVYDCSCRPECQD